jgi:L-rhamnonate dehydratase
MKKNVEWLTKHRESVGPDFPRSSDTLSFFYGYHRSLTWICLLLVMVDCYMSLNVPYAIELASRCMKDDIDINWFEGASLYPSLSIP